MISVWGCSIWTLVEIHNRMVLISHTFQAGMSNYWHPGARWPKVQYIAPIYMSPAFQNFIYWSNSEYWSQKRIQNGSIHSIILDVHALKQSALDLSFNSPNAGKEKNYALASSSSQFVRTGTIDCLTLASNFHLGCQGDRKKAEFQIGVRPLSDT